MAMLRHLGTRPIHLFFINPAWGRRARHVRLSRCQDGARENQRCSVTVCHWLWLVLVCTGTVLQVIGAAGRTTARGRPDRAYTSESNYDIQRPDAYARRDFPGRQNLFGIAIVPLFPIRAKTEKNAKPPRKSIGCNAGLQRVGDSQREV